MRDISGDVEFCGEIIVRILMVGWGFNVFVFCCGSFGCFRRCDWIFLVLI